MMVTSFYILRHFSFAGVRMVSNTYPLPERINTEAELEDLLSFPSPPVVESLAKLEGDILLLGAGGKMGPTMAKMARRASDLAGIDRRVIAVSRFSDSSVQTDLLNNNVETISCDLLNRDSLDRLPNIPNVLYLAAQKFGTTGQEWMTWAMNVYLPGIVAERFRESKIVAFSTGNVYPFVPVESGGCREEDPTGPVGEYAQSCLGRERMFQYAAQVHGTRSVLIRLNYAVELRYGVLVDVALKVLNQKPIDLRMGYVNVIWQGDANAYTLRAFELCNCPPEILNVTGPGVLSVRSLAESFGLIFGKKPVFVGQEEPAALLNNAQKCFIQMGEPVVSLETMQNWIADWLIRGGSLHNKPTHFEEREGKY